MRLLIVSVLFLSGCISMPADLRVYESKTDNVKHISLAPGWLYAAYIKMGLHKRSDMKPDEVTLIVEVKNNAVATKDGLTINIDGKKTTFSSMDDLSDYSEGFFRKRFDVKLDYIRQMVAGKSVWVKVTHVGQTYSEGEFSRDGMTTARPGFVKFLAAVDGK